MSQSRCIRYPILAVFVLLALGLFAGVPSKSSAAVFYEFEGFCAEGCTGTATGLLTLRAGYVPGSDAVTADFISFVYTSNNQTIAIPDDFFVKPEPGFVFSAVGLPAIGSAPAIVEMSGLASGEAWTSQVNNVVGEDAWAQILFNTFPVEEGNDHTWTLVAIPVSPSGVLSFSALLGLALVTANRRRRQRAEV